MSNDEFASYPGRAEMLELIRQRENHDTPQEPRDTEERAWPICVFQPTTQS